VTGISVVMFGLVVFIVAAVAPISVT